MRVGACVAAFAFLAFAEGVPAQAPPSAAPPAARTSPAPDRWRTASAVNSPAAAAQGDATARPSSPTGSASGEAQPLEPLRDIANIGRRPIARVTSGTSSLPSDAGQVWREYDISPYTVRVTSTNRPEQAIVDWILRETGYEVWHGDPVSLLSANSRALRVYHVPEMQAVVSDVVDRFVNSEAESQAFTLKVVTVGHPNWRAKAQSMLRPIEVQTQGVQAWVLQREDAALLVAELRKRTDFKEHSAPMLLVNNGQSTSVAATRRRGYIRDVVARNEAWPAFEPQAAQFDEGFSLELSPLLSLDGRTIDAVIKCNIDQLEKLVPVVLDVPSAVAPAQRTRIEVPQISHCRLHERFRWPTELVLLVNFGVVATPVPVDPNPLLAALPLPQGPARADLLVFVECKGKLSSQAQPLATPRTSQGPLRNTRGRY